MRNFHSRRPSGAMLVAGVALFVALGGTAYAATSINGKNIQDRTITGSKLKNKTLTGTQINESKLGTVPRATNALHLGGVAASSYPRGVHIVSSALVPNSGILAITVAAACPSGEVALGGGGNNTAPTGSVTFDRAQLDATSFTVTEFELVPGTPVSWTAQAEVACAKAG